MTKVIVSTSLCHKNQIRDQRPSHPETAAENISPKYFSNRAAKTMVNKNKSMSPNQSNAAQPEEERFQPKGAIAFFILLILLDMIIWYGIYSLMLHRS